jgi:hypothetical protein
MAQCVVSYHLQKVVIQSSVFIVKYKIRKKNDPYVVANMLAVYSHDFQVIAFKILSRQTSDGIIHQHPAVEIKHQK